jgi:hypothetical protein
MKKVLLGFAVVFVVLVVLDLLIHNVLLAGAYESMQNVWRSDMAQKMWILYIVKLFVAFFFSFIFSKGYENKGIAEGVRYGFYMGLLLGVPYAYGTYASFAIPYYVALQWFIYALVEYIIAGIALALVFRSPAPPAPPAQT